MNGDGKSDLFIGGASGQAGHLFFQSLDGFKDRASPALQQDRMSEDMEALIVDIDNDEDNDLIVISGGNEHPAQSKYYADRLYINDGKGNFSRADHLFTDPTNIVANPYRVWTTIRMVIWIW